MGKPKAYQPSEKYKNYSLPTSKPSKGPAFYKERVWSLQEQIYKQLKKVAEFLESLYPKLTDDYGKSTKIIVKKNIETLVKDLDLMQASLLKNPGTFNTNNLKTNQQHITDMKNVCNTLQTFKSFKHEVKHLGKLKHALTELEHLIQPTNFETYLEKARARVKNRVPAKLVGANKKIKEESKVKPKNKVTIAAKPIKVQSKQPEKTKTPPHKPKQSEKKAATPKQKLPAKNVLKAKPKSKNKSSAAPKKK